MIVIYTHGKDSIIIGSLLKKIGLFTYPHIMKWINVGTFIKNFINNFHVDKTELIKKIYTTFTHDIFVYNIYENINIMSVFYKFYTYPQHLYILINKFIKKDIIYNEL